MARSSWRIEVPMACGREGSGLVPELRGKVLPFLNAWDSVRLRTASTHWNVPGKYGPHGELLFFLIQKKPAMVPNSEAFNSFTGDGFQVPELKGESESSGVACHWIAWIW